MIRTTTELSLELSRGGPISAVSGRAPAGRRSSALPGGGPRRNSAMHREETERRSERLAGRPADGSSGHFALVNTDLASSVTPPCGFVDWTVPGWNVEKLTAGSTATLGSDASVGACRRRRCPEAHADHWQIFQTASLLAIVGEALHETRFIWLDRDTAAGPSGWLGYSTGRWTGDTLTATTTRFRTETGEAGTLPADPIPGMHRGTGSDLTLAETWTAAGRDAIDYEITLDDPSVYTVPVRYRYRLRRAPAGTALYEYACHEGNRSMVGILRGARHDEQRARTASRIGVAARAWGGHPGVTAPARPFLPRERLPLR